MQGATLYRYTGDGVAWSWSTPSEVTHELHGEWAEFFLSADQLGSVDGTIRAFLFGNNTAKGDVCPIPADSPDDALRKGGGKFIRIKMR